MIIGERVYHYTSISTLYHLVESIDESENKDSFIFRASNIFFMNDPEELILGQKVLMEMVTDIEKEFSIDESCKLSNLWKLNEHNSSEEWQKVLTRKLQNSYESPFVLSFSRQKDYLPMWMSYGDRGKGVCLVFKENEFDLSYHIDNGSMNFIDNNIANSLGVLDVEYCDSCHEKCHENGSPLYRKVEKLYNALYYKKYKEIKPDSLYSYQESVLDALNLVVSPYIKSTVYEGEKEVRIAKTIKHNYKNDIRKLNFRCNYHGNIIPYINIEIPMDLIDNIIIGPLANFDLTEKALEMMKKRYNLAFNINSSEVKFREY